jgi:hypothetical protein
MAFRKFQTLKSLSGQNFRTYLIEFMTEDGKSTDESFSFSVPPENEELTYGQRKSETKTFGGLHVDDYGAEAVRISISGSTVNQELKKVYQKSGNKLLTGEQEVYRFRDLIVKYKIGTENIKRKIFVQDLSKFGNEGGKISNVWQAFLGDFKIRRSNDRPFTYKYTFEFTGVDTEHAGQIDEFSNTEAVDDAPDPKDVLPDFLSKIANLIRSAVEILQKALAFIDRVNSFIGEIMGLIDDILELIDILANIVNYAIDTLTSVVDAVKRIISLPREIQLKVLNIGLELQNSTLRLVKAVDNLSNEVEGMFTSEYWQVPQEVLDEYDMNNEEFKATIRSIINETEDNANYLAAAAKSSAIPEVTIGNPNQSVRSVQTDKGQTSAGTTGNTQGANATIVLSYGNKNVTITDTDTLESLAQTYYGSPDRAIDIATYNGIASLEEVSVGSTIKIPILQKSKAAGNNRIYARREDRDNYGKDILINDNGMVEASVTGDFKLTGDVTNLEQAVLLRLKESVRKRIRLNMYGIKTNISDPSASVAYIISSIDMTMRAEPRISEVDNISFKGAGDTLDVTVDYRDINNISGNFTGRA